MPDPSQDDIHTILRKMKDAIQCGNDHLCHNDGKNQRTLAKMGRLWSDAKMELMGLSPSHYKSGPEPSINFPGRFVWKFKMIIDGLMIYIKFEICEDNNGLADFISFHEDGMV